MQLLSILTKNDTAPETAAMKRLERIVTQYDISPYVFTNKIVVESQVIPHSHPILTLNSFPYTDDNIVLETFIHEQLHWFFESRQEDVDGAVEELKQKYPNAPWGPPVGCVDQTSTYEHLLLCWLSNQAMHRLVGTDAAAKVLYYLQNHHYIWVNQEIERSPDYLKGLVEEHGLAIQ
jgi:hypothetical protein